MNGFYGITTTEFEPEKKLTRAEAARMLSILFEYNQNLNCESFDDVEKSNRNYPFIQSLRCNKVIYGFSNNEFKPTSTLTATELVNLIGRIKNINIADANTQIENIENLDLNADITRMDATKIIYQFLSL